MHVSKDTYNIFFESKTLKFTERSDNRENARFPSTWVRKTILIIIIKGVEKSTQRQMLYKNESWKNHIYLRTKLHLCDSQN